MTPRSVFGGAMYFDALTMSGWPLAMAKAVSYTTSDAADE